MSDVISAFFSFSAASVKAVPVRWIFSSRVLIKDLFPSFIAMVAKGSGRKEASICPYSSMLRRKGICAISGLFISSVLIPDFVQNRSVAYSITVPREMAILFFFNC